MHLARGNPDWVRVQRRAPVQAVQRAVLALACGAHEMDVLSGDRARRPVPRSSFMRTKSPGAPGARGRLKGFNIRPDLLQGLAVPSPFGGVPSSVTSTPPYAVGRIRRSRPLSGPCGRNGHQPCPVRARRTARQRGGIRWISRARARAAATTPATAHTSRRLARARVHGGGRALARQCPQRPRSLRDAVALEQRIEVDEQAYPTCGRRLTWWSGYWRWVRGVGTARL